MHATDGCMLFCTANMSLRAYLYSFDQVFVWKVRATVSIIFQCSLIVQTLILYINICPDREPVWWSTNSCLIGSSDYPLVSSRHFLFVCCRFPVTSGGGMLDRTCSHWIVVQSTVLCASDRSHRNFQLCIQDVYIFATIPWVKRSESTDVHRSFPLAPQLVPDSFRMRLFRHLTFWDNFSRWPRLQWPADPVFPGNTATARDSDQV